MTAVLPAVRHVPRRRIEDGTQPFWHRIDHFAAGTYSKIRTWTWTRSHVVLADLILT